MCRHQGDDILVRVTSEGNSTEGDTSEGDIMGEDIIEGINTLG